MATKGGVKIQTVWWTIIIMIEKYDFFFCKLRQTKSEPIRVHSIAP